MTIGQYDTESFHQIWGGKNTWNQKERLHRCTCQGHFKSDKFKYLKDKKLCTSKWYQSGSCSNEKICYLLHIVEVLKTLRCLLSQIKCWAGKAVGSQRNRTGISCLPDRCFVHLATRTQQPSSQTLTILRALHTPLPVTELRYLRDILTYVWAHPGGVADVC